MSYLNVRHGLLAMVLLGAVSAVEEAPAVDVAAVDVAAVDVAAVELAANIAPVASEELLFFDKPGCNRRSDHGSSGVNAGVSFVDFCSDVVVPKKKKSLFIQESFKDRQIAAYSDYKKTKHGEIECCGEFLGFIECGCYDLDTKQTPHYHDRHFSLKEKEPECRVQCLRPLDNFYPEYSKYATISARGDDNYDYGYEEHEHGGYKHDDYGYEEHEHGGYKHDDYGYEEHERGGYKHHDYGYDKHGGYDKHDKHGYKEEHHHYPPTCCPATPTAVVTPFITTITTTLISTASANISTRLVETLVLSRIA